MKRQLPAPTPIRVVEDSGYQRIQRVVWESLDRWEDAAAVGGARPVFARAWMNALHLEGYPQSEQLALVREKLYQRWLREGARLTPETRQAILMSRPTARRILDGLQIGVDREPGEDG